MPGSLLETRRPPLILSFSRREKGRLHNGRRHRSLSQRERDRVRGVALGVVS
jgi:hypothetical protein